MITHTKNNENGKATLQTELNNLKQVFGDKN